MRTQVVSRAGECFVVVLPMPTPPNPARWNPALEVRFAAWPAGPDGDPDKDAADGPAGLGDQIAQDQAQNPIGPILVVDDDESILATVHEILEDEGYAVVAVSEGAEALRRAEEVRPSLLLLDMRMPGMTGWEVAHQLYERGIAVPILVMTAAQDARLWSEQIGAAGFLAKPFDLDDLITAVDRLLST